MSIFIVYLSLLLDQIKPASHHVVIHRALAAAIEAIEHRFNAGGEHHARVIWCVTVLAPTVVVALIHHLLSGSNSFLSFLLSLGILYTLVGLRAYNQSLSQVLESFEKGQETESRQHLSAWQKIDPAQLPRGSTCVQINEQSVMASHQQVLGVVFWFVFSSLLGWGAAGAVLYVLAWHHIHRLPTQADAEPHIAQTYWEWIDYIPARLTAIGYVVVGDFEEALAAWRRASSLWKLTSTDMLLATASGATGAPMGHLPANTQELDIEPLTTHISPTLSEPDEKTQIQQLRSVSALIWRTMALWLVLLTFVVIITSLSSLTRAVFG
jgi:adenosylcobinamide-phosphate synthase